MKYGIMRSFMTHHSKTGYGLSSNGDKVSLFSKAGELEFQGVEFGIDLDYREDPLWTGNGDLRQSMKEAAQATGAVYWLLRITVCALYQYDLIL